MSARIILVERPRGSLFARIYDADGANRVDLEARTRRALERLVTALGSGDAAALTAIFER